MNRRIALMSNDRLWKWLIVRDRIGFSGVADWPDKLNHCNIAYLHFPNSPSERKALRDLMVFDMKARPQSAGWAVRAASLNTWKAGAAMKRAFGMSEREAWAAHERALRGRKDGSSAAGLGPGSCSQAGGTERFEPNL